MSSLYAIIPICERKCVFPSMKDISKISSMIQAGASIPIINKINDLVPPIPCEYGLNCTRYVRRKQNSLRANLSNQHSTTIILHPTTRIGIYSSKEERTKTRFLLHSFCYPFCWSTKKRLTIPSPAFVCKNRDRDSTLLNRHWSLIWYHCHFPFHCVIGRNLV